MEPFLRMTHFDLLVFTVDPARARAVVAGGAAAVMVDWECRGKAERQLGADTEINEHGAKELRRLRRETDVRLVCRVNGMHDASREEIDLAVACGADEILLPMVRSAEEVRQLVEWTQGRAEPGIMVETRQALALAPELSRFPLRRVYVGLNDLAIDRGSTNLFQAVADGTLDHLRPHVTTSFGFGGLTLPDLGFPLPCRLLRGEILRLGGTFSFLRRSFWRDVGNGDPEEAVRRILRSVEDTARRSSAEVEADRLAMREAVERLLAAA